MSWFWGYWTIHIDCHLKLFKIWFFPSKQILKIFFLISTLSGTLEVIKICWYRSALHNFPKMLLFNLNTSIDRKLTPYQRNPSYLEADLILWKLSLHWPQICLYLIFTLSSYFSLLLISKELIKLFCGFLVY